MWDTTAAEAWPGSSFLPHHLLRLLTSPHPHKPAATVGQRLPSAQHSFSSECRVQAPAARSLSGPDLSPRSLICTFCCLLGFCGCFSDTRTQHEQHHLSKSEFPQKSVCSFPRSLRKGTEGSHLWALWGLRVLPCRKLPCSLPCRTQRSSIQETSPSPQSTMQAWWMTPSPNTLASHMELFHMPTIRIPHPVPTALFLPWLMSFGSYCISRILRITVPELPQRQEGMKRGKSRQCESQDSVPAPH